MDTSLSESPAPVSAPASNPPNALRTIGDIASRLARCVYVHNPLYAASAWMVFRGLRASFDTTGGTFSVNMLTLCLSGYTVLLAVTAYFVIRVGKVWDDARSLLLLIVLMFLGIAVTLDDVLAAIPTNGIWYCLVGWLLAALLSEVLLWSIRLRLPALFRLPYHALLALFFLYPVILIPSIGNPTSPLLQWQLFGFGPAAAVALLALIPAVRRGPAYVHDCGNPWRWPGFPWALFGTLGLCAALRGYYLCLSLHFVDYDDSIFGPYFLAPLVLAAAILLLEGGLISRSRLAINLGLLLPASMVILASVGHRDDRIYRGFLDLFTTGLGASPLYITVMATVVFYAVAAARRVRFAGDALTAALVLWAFVEPASLDLRQVGTPLPGLLMLAAAWQLCLGLLQRASWRVLSAGWVLIAALTILFKETWFTAGHGALPIQLLMITLLATGMLFDDWFSRLARYLGAALSVCLLVVVVLKSEQWFPEAAAWIQMAYPLALTVVLLLCGLLVRDRWSVAAASVCFMVWGLAVATRSYEHLRPHLIGLNQLAWGLLFFVLAALISLSKARLPRFKPGWLKPSSEIELTTRTRP